MSGDENTCTKRPLTATQSSPVVECREEEEVPSLLQPPGSQNGNAGAAQRSLSLSSDGRGVLSRQLQCILEDPENPPPKVSSEAPPSCSGGARPKDNAGTTTDSEGRKMTPAQVKRASLVKKAIRYFEDKSNRSVSEDNLFTRRKNLAVHLGLDEKVPKKEVQKINTFSLPVPSSATSFDLPDPINKAKDVIVVEDDEALDDDIKSKNLVTFLGMKDGLTASIASQGSLSETDSPRASIISRSTTLTTTTSVEQANIDARLPPSVGGGGGGGGRNPKLTRAQSMAAAPVSASASASSAAMLSKKTSKEMPLLKF